MINRFDIFRDNHNKSVEAIYRYLNDESDYAASLANKDSDVTRIFCIKK